MNINQSINQSLLMKLTNRRCKIEAVKEYKDAINKGFTERKERETTRTGSTGAARPGEYSQRHEQDERTRVVSEDADSR